MRPAKLCVYIYSMRVYTQSMCILTHSLDGRVHIYVHILKRHMVYTHTHTHTHSMCIHTLTVWAARVYIPQKKKALAYPARSKSHYLLTFKKKDFYLPA